MTAAPPNARLNLLRDGIRLEVFTVAWNGLEAVVGLAAGLAAGSVALTGFALDSVVESSSGTIVLWRLMAERSGVTRSEDAERKAIRGVAVAFLALAAFVAVRAAIDLITRSTPDASPVGMGLTAVSLVVMPVLAMRKRSVARALDSRSVQADSAQTMLCTYLSAAVLAGLALNAGLGWWWADPVAALTLAALAAREGRELWRTKDLCCV